MMMTAMSNDPSPAADRATEFTAVTETGEHFNGYTLLVEAYAALWLILMGWLLLVWRKQATLSARVDGLENAIARAAGQRSAKTATEAEKVR